MREVHLTTVLLLAGWLSSCAIVDSKIKIDYAPRSTPQLLPGRPRFSVAVPLNQTRLPRQGIKKNGYGMETADIYTDPHPEIIVFNALLFTLQKAGATISENRYPRLELELLDFFAEPEVGFFGADVYAVADARIRVVYAPDRQYTRRIKGIGKYVTLVWPDIAYRMAIALALDDFTNKALAAIAELLNEGQQ